MIYITLFRILVSAVVINFCCPFLSYILLYVKKSNFSFLISFCTSCQIIVMICITLSRILVSAVFINFWCPFLSYICRMLRSRISLSSSVSARLVFLLLASLSSFRLSDCNNFRFKYVNLFLF